MPRIKNWIDTNITLKEGVKRRDEILASVSHGVGFLAAVIATILMVIQANGSSRALWAALIYGLTMCAVFGGSSLYHWLEPSTSKRVMRLIDHSSIYMLIAGTYTPYTLAMGGGGDVMLIAIWSLCIIGLILNFVLWDRLVLLHIGIYLLMGWMVVFFWRDLVATAPIDQIRWMFFGGGFYTLGVFFYMFKKLPLTHFYWHLFVICGAVGLHVGIVKYAIPNIMG